MLKSLIYLLALFCSIAITNVHAEPITVKVGGYIFPPFVDMNAQKSSGLTLDLIDLFNHHQTEFHFTFVATSPKRRYNDFKRGIFDVIFFESMEWGWSNNEMEKSQIFLSGGEVFFTQNLTNRTQNYFHHLNDKRIVAMLGYHYDFLNKQHNKKYPDTDIKVSFVSSPKALINQVLNNKADMGIATYAYLKNEIKQHPHLAKKFLINKHFDQTYQHRILIRKHQALKITKINELLTKIEKNGALKNLLQAYNLTPLNQ